MANREELAVWPIVWSAMWIGALSALAVGLLIGLGGFAVGAHEAAQLADWKKALVIRNASLAAVTALLLGLVGAVIGGWMASGEPMTLTHYRGRVRTVRST